MLSDAGINKNQMSASSGEVSFGKDYYSMGMFSGLRQDTGDYYIPIRPGASLSAIDQVGFSILDTISRRLRDVNPETGTSILENNGGAIARVLSNFAHEVRQL